MIIKFQAIKGLMKSYCRKMVVLWLRCIALSSRGITISIDGKGRATDNICIERFWRSAKCERIYLNEYGSLPELRSDLTDYIDFYNHRRFHESLGYKKPMNVYKEGALDFKSQAQKTLQVA
ncbi:integrase core domain-containing protein [Cysteiniphilum marinum]|uniref:integrase core domain-containing protein n=2 Tax=Cysteiniphilum marinum TaxID=2774191 RepID=UPI0039A5D2AD